MPVPISTINYFPDSHEYEHSAGYRFTDKQKEEYLRKMDSISIENGLPPLSEFAKDFEFCRALWLGARIGHTPKLQQFRYDLIVESLKW